MVKNYNIGKSSDMRKFQRDMEKNMKNQTVNSINEMNFDAECPNCGNAIKVKSGLNRCPSCDKEINFNLEINL